MFFNKSACPHIKFIPSLEGLKQYNPILPAKDVLPDWWKRININQDVDLVNNNPISTGTVKRCPGVMDVLHRGWVIRAWCDIYVNVIDKNTMEFELSDARFAGQIHSNAQLINLLPSSKKDYYHFALKLVNPWFIETSPGYSVLYMDPFYHFNEFFDSAYGVQDTDIFHTSNVFLFLKKQGKFVIEKDTPLCIILPFKNEAIYGEMQEYDAKTVNTMRSKGDFISYSKFSSFLRYKKEQVLKRAKCPFAA